MYFPKYSEDSENELKINKLLKSNNNIAKLFDNFYYENSCCLIYQLLGITLLDLNSYFDNKIPLDILKKITYSVLEGINELHEHNIIHCDLKHENIMIDCFPNNISNIINISDTEKIYKDFMIQKIYQVIIIYLIKLKKKNIEKRLKINV